MGPELTGPRAALDAETDTEFGTEDFGDDSLLRAVAAAPPVPLEGESNTGQLQPGAVLQARFEIRRVLGSGGMGVVYLAYDDRLEREVALKLHTVSRDLDRLLAEAKSMARLSHPNVLTVHDVGTLDDGRLFIAMEYVDGSNAREWQKAETRSWVDVLELYISAGLGLVAAHAVGLVHRDFKPDNVLVGNDGRVRVADFGLARPATGASADAAVERTLDGQSTDRTVTGAVAGTPAYMAPEQVDARGVDARADQFAFCVSLYEALYAQRPWKGIHRLDQPLRRPGDSDVPKWVFDTLQRGLATQPQDRHRDMSTLVEALRRGLRRRGRPARVALALAVAAVAGGTGAWAASRGDDAAAICAAGSELVATVWNEERRETLALAYAKTNRPDEGARAWAETAARVDAYAAAWDDVHRNACEAARADPQALGPIFGLQRSCLEERLDELDALLRALAETTPEIAALAPEAVASLLPPSTCSDLPTLRAQIPPPEDPIVAREVEAIRSELNGIHASSRLGQARDAHDRAVELRASHQTLSYLPTRIELDLVLGQLRLNLGEVDEAKSSLEETFFAAQQGDYDALSARAAITMTWLEGYHRADYAKADLWARLALSLSDRPTMRPNLHAAALGAAGVLRELEGDYEGALAFADEGLAIWETFAGPRAADTASAHLTRGTALDGLGRYPEALAAIERAIEIYREAGLGGGPSQGDALTNAGLVLTRMERFDEAIARHEEALAVAERVGRGSSDVGFKLLNLGIAYIGAEELQEARSTLERALEMVESELGPDHPDVALCTAGLGAALFSLGEFEKAEASYQRSVHINEATLPADHPELASTRTNLARTRQAWAASLESKDPVRARGLVARALEACGQEPPEFCAEARALSDRLGEG